MNSPPKINPFQAARYNDYLIDLYKNKRLGYDSYSSGKEKYTTEDFSNLDRLLDFLYNCRLTSESCITAAGKAFIKYYWGWDRLAEILLIHNDKDLNCSLARISKEEFSALKHWESIAAIANGLRNIAIFPEVDPACEPDQTHDDKAQIDY